MIYFDHNATSPLLPAARAAWLEAEDQFPGNPSSPHRLGSRAEAGLDDARQRLAAILGCPPLDVVFTSGATEACNTVLWNAAATAGSERAVWLSAVEHPAVIESARAAFGSRVQFIPVDGAGVIRLEWLQERLARETPVLVAVMAANNETGVLQPWREASALCAARGVSFFTDATQWCGRIAARDLGGCDFVAGSAHKFGGPRGVGFLKVPGGPRGARLRPLLSGGKQQAGRRAGTENVPGVRAMVAALEWCAQRISERADESRREARDRFERQLLATVPDVRINSGAADRLWNTSNVIMPSADCRPRWVVKLDKAGFAVSTGSACASGAEHPSHVLTAMGLSADEAARALRFSAGWLTTDANWQALLDAIAGLQREFSASGTKSAGDTTPVTAPSTARERTPAG